MITYNFIVIYFKIGKINKIDESSISLFNELKSEEFFESGSMSIWIWLDIIV